jgi:hypothetical protein
MTEYNHLNIEENYSCVSIAKLKSESIVIIGNETG